MLDGRSVAELEGDELLTYSQLGDLIVVLSARKVRLTADDDFLKWFAEDAWPVVKSVAPVVLAML